MSETDVLKYTDKYGKEHSFDVDVIFVCDAPAKAFILGTKYFNTYGSCTKCKVQGHWANMVVFTDSNAPLRTDGEFRSQRDEDYHNNQTILTRLQVDLINNVMLDYMHLVCLGVVKKMLLSWISGQPSVRIGKQQRRTGSFRQVCPVQA